MDLQNDRNTSKFGFTNACFKKIEINPENLQKVVGLNIVSQNNSEPSSQNKTKNFTENIEISHTNGFTNFRETNPDQNMFSKPIIFNNKSNNTIKERFDESESSNFISDQNSFSFGNLKHKVQNPDNRAKLSNNIDFNNYTDQAVS